MADLDFETIQRLTAAYMADWVNSLAEPDKPVVRGAGVAGSSLSPRQMLTHVQQGTALGKKLVYHWVATAIDKEARKAVSGGPDSETRRGHDSER